MATKKQTPWGTADGMETLAEGIISYSTPSHGGIWLSKARQAQIPAETTNFLKTLEWWEEDCDWVVPYLLFAEDIRRHGHAYKFQENLEHARIIAQHYHPELVTA